MTKLIAIILNVLMLFFGELPINQTYTQDDIYQIVDTALIKGELANFLYMGEFYFHDNGYELDSNGNCFCEVTIGTDKLPLAVPSSINAGEWQGSLNSTAALQNVFQAAFIQPLAEQYWQDLSNKYRIQDEHLYINNIQAMYPLSFIQWQHRPLEILTNRPNEITVLLAGRFMLTGTETNLPLTLHKQKDQWLLDESFSPQEQQPEDYYYNPTELQNIVDDVLYRANQANIMYSPDSFESINEYNAYGNPINSYELINTASQYNEEALKIVQEIKTTAAVKKCFTEAFIPETANSYIEFLFYSDWLGFPLYKDLPEGLAVTHQVATFPITMSAWQANDYIVWQNTQDKIILIMRSDLYNYYQNIYRPLFLYNIDGRWLCDKSYGLPMNGLFAWTESQNNFTWQR